MYEFRKNGTFKDRMAEEEKSVMEGFLCPICKADLGTPDKLVLHFQNEHSEDQDLLKSFKDLLGIAKKKILKEDGNHGISFGRQRELFQWEPQEIGATSSHLKYFEEARSARLQRLFVPTNQLIIRLDKLLDNMPADPIKKKAHEQNIVPWLNGEAVPRCPNCTRSFHVARRQHHCRLCGSIICHDCSLFLPLSIAMKMLDRVTEVQKNSEMTLRVCSHCLSLLEGRELLKESRNCKPVICQLYEKLVECKEQADEHAAMYTKMCNSLSEGETIYSLNDAQALRMTIVKLAETIDVISGKILNLEAPPEGGNAAIRLQKSVRMATTAYMRTQLLRLPPLLSESDYKYAQFTRRQQIQAKIQEEKSRESKLKSPGVKPEFNSPQHRITAPVQTSTNDIQDVSLGQGWVPEKKKFFDVDDPLLLQMNILRNYIQEARAAHKYDEVVSLEANLQELKDEYWKQQQELDDLASREESYTSGSDTTTTLESMERDEGSQSNNSDNV